MLASVYIHLLRIRTRTYVHSSILTPPPPDLSPFPLTLTLTLTLTSPPPPPPPTPDIIVDMLGNLKFRNILIEHYKESREPKWVKRAIKEALYDANMSLYSKEATDGG